MNYYGDVSGHFKGLLNGECELVVVGVVAGDQVSCGRCPKRAVRRADDIPEAKWNDLNDIQKRRLFECFEDEDHLDIGYAVFDREKFYTMDKYHHLYQDVSFPPAWDLALTGYAYGEILFEMDALDDRHGPFFEFDRVASKKQSKAVMEHVEEFVPDADVLINGSRQCDGIQAADCIAGAIGEDTKHGTDWMDYLEDKELTESSYTALLKLETALSNI